MDPDDHAGRRERILHHFAALEGKAGAILHSLPGDEEELFFWKLADQRAPSWVKGRVVLLGDAAGAFLPTAGIGASMAMESAAVLADELSRTDVAHLDHSLAFYETRRRKRRSRPKRQPAHGAHDVHRDGAARLGARPGAQVLLARSAREADRQDL
jgi:2-polyprenyl-6-methoxyphenol hydroxylase-like FAD-dependent oxidoreductase